MVCLDYGGSVEILICVC